MRKVPETVKRTVAIIAIALASAALVLAMVYFFAFPAMTIVSDPAFNQVLPKAELRRLGLSLAAQGIRLKVETLQSNSLGDAEAFVSAISKAKGSWVLLSPAASAFAVSNGINVCELLPKSLTIAIFTNPDTGLFDCTLVSDEDSGWSMAARTIAVEMATTSKNAALVYEKDRDKSLDAIREAFRTGWLSQFEDDGESRLFVSETMTELDRQGIFVVLCPYESRLSDFFRSPGTVSWVVDYRFAPAVPKDQLYGIVKPNLKEALQIAMGCEKGSIYYVNMEYAYGQL